MNKSSFKFFSILACSFVTQCLTAQNANIENEELCPITSRVDRLSVSHREGGGIGYNKGYTSFDAFFSMPSNNYFPFFDLRAHVFNDGKWAANAGFGVRKLLNNSPWILGANAFYDYRHALHTNFNQIGLGFESLGTKWDFHANGYIPVGRNRRNYANPFRAFVGNSAFFTRKYEINFGGADILAGREFWSCDDYLLRGALGAYFLKGHFNKKTFGGLFKLTAEITRYVHVEGQLSYDHIFKWKPQGELRINLPLGKKVYLSRCGRTCCNLEKLSRQMVAPVDRFEIIPTLTKKKVVLATDASGQPLHFIFVNNLLGHSDGSFENPFQSLAEAAANSKPGDVLVVGKGDGTTNGMSAGIVLKDGQQLVGGGVNLGIKSFGKFVIIPLTPQGIPLITNTGAGPAVTLASGNTVQGIAFVNTGTAISGAGVVNANINNNTFDGITVNSIDLEVLSGNIAITNNTATGSGGFAIATNTSSTSTININFNQILRPPAGDGIDMNVNGTHQTLTTILGNTFSAQSGTLSKGIVFNFSNTTISTVSVAHNLIQNVQQNGIISTTNSATTTLRISNNVIDGFDLAHANNPAVDVVASAGGRVDLAITGNETLNPPSPPPFGYVLDASGGGSQIVVHSPNGAISGVQAINQGFFQVPPIGNVVFVSP